MARQGSRIKELVKILNGPCVIRSDLKTPLIPAFQLWKSFSCKKKKRLELGLDDKKIFTKRLLAKDDTSSLGSPIYATAWEHHSKGHQKGFPNRHQAQRNIWTSNNGKTKGDQQ